MAEAAGVVGAALGPPQAASAPWQLEEEGADSARPAAMSWGAPGPVGGEAVVASAPVMAEGLGAVLVLGVLLEALGQLESLWCRLRVSQPQRCCRLAWAALMWGILGTTGCGAAALVSTHHVPGAPLPHSLSHINQKCLPKLPRVPWAWLASAPLSPSLWT